jgi:glycosyltransferase involved in cell wall biosynthesis
MRILMIWSENLNKPGSGRTHFMGLVRALAARGHEVRIVAPGYPPRTTEPLGVPVSYIPTLRRSIVAFIVFHLFLLAAMPHLLRRYRPAVVYTRGLFHSFLVYVVCWVFRVPYVAEIDSIVDEELAMREWPRAVVWLVRFLDRWNLRWASAFVCVTRKLRDELVDRGAKAERIDAIHNGAAVDVFVPGDRAEARRRLGLPEEPVLIGFAGTLAAWQGLDLLIDAAALLPADAPPWHVLIVGDGEMHDRLVGRVAERRLAHRVRLLPAVPHHEVALYLQAFDLAVVPIHDPRKLRYGLSVLKFWEALSAGLPVLVPDGGDLGDVLRSLNWPGEFAAGDAAGLSRAILDVIGRLDECRARRHEIHEAMCRDHSWDAVARRTEEVFERVVALRSEDIL